MIDSEPAVGRLIPANAICKDFGVCRRSIGRRIHDDPGFPKPVRIAGRLYWQEIEIENRTASRMAVIHSASATALSTPMSHMCQIL
jgi:predicted DNA-binding transcriptional regulator AlpA